MQKKLRLAIIDHEKCKPKKCNHECKKICPVERTGKHCIDIEEVAIISEINCIGCNMCVGNTSNNIKSSMGCPFGAIQIVNLPNEIESHLVYTYGENCFRLYKLPIPKLGKIYGIIGPNGVGKSTILNILSGKNKPNYGQINNNMDIKDILKNVQGTELHKYLTSLYSNKLKIIHKPQNINIILDIYKKDAKRRDNTVIDMLNKHWKHDNEEHNNIIASLELDKILDNKIINLSGGELQKLLCAVVIIQEADVYIFDEPTNFLDIKQRLKIANLIRSLINPHRYIFVVEHDLSILDYVSDQVSIMYGKPSAYGIISRPIGTSEAINIFFNGYIPGENVKFRSTSYNFKDSLNIVDDDIIENDGLSFEYGNTIIEYDNFKLKINGGMLPLHSNLVILLGKNGTGKTTFLKYLSQELELTVSHKPQYIDVNKFKLTNGEYCTVKEYLQNNINNAISSELFKTDVIKPLNLNAINDKFINNLSGGELQRFTIALCLGTKADVYLIDEPSASLDIEQRVIVTKVIKRFLMHNKKTGFIVEHDIMMSISLTLSLDNCRIILFSENDNNDNKRVADASVPLSVSDGINNFLEQLNITFRTDIVHRRPRINKLDSQKDKEQKQAKNYYVY